MVQKKRLTKWSAFFFAFYLILNPVLCDGVTQIKFSD